jgi:hypothetical protein
MSAKFHRVSIFQITLDGKRNEETKQSEVIDESHMDLELKGQHTELASVLQHCSVEEQQPSATLFSLKYKMILSVS